MGATAVGPTELYVRLKSREEVAGRTMAFRLEKPANRSPRQDFICKSSSVTHEGASDAAPIPTTY
jgi:hypothetical protein